MQRYRLQAYSASTKIALEQARELFVGSKFEQLSRECLLLERFEDEKVFIFRFGALVFFNVPPTEHEYYLRKLNLSAGSGSAQPELTDDSFLLTIEPGVTRVAFNSVTLPDLDTTKLQLVCQVFAQSSALELVEHAVERFLAESERMTALFQSKGSAFGKRQQLIHFLGEGLRARHRIVTQLSLLKEPEKTWEKEDLYVLYKGLFANFEIEDRIEKCEHMIQLSSQVTELLLELVNARRAEIMELTIIILIGFEIVKSFF